MDALEAHLQRQVDHSRDFFWHRVRWAAVDGQLSGIEFTLTDVGAGIGLVGDLMRVQYPNATYKFVEPLDSLVTELEERFGPEANANDAQAYTGSHYITLLDVLEHIEDDVKFLTELATKMESGAVLIMTVPALNRLWSSWDVALGHHRRYDKRMLRSAFRQLPFRLDEISYLFPEMLPAAVVRRVRRGDDEANEQQAEFPDLNSSVNELLYRIGKATLAGRRVWPAGTSLLAVAQRL